ncbi:Uncharacterised protein [Shigella sonnei]|nr:Uncharacterised protein [Shigella sonnei]
MVTLLLPFFQNCVMLLSLVIEQMAMLNFSIDLATLFARGTKFPEQNGGMAHLLVKHQMQSKHSWLRLYGWLIGQYFILSQLSTFKQILFYIHYVRRINRHI